MQLACTAPSLRRGREQSCLSGAAAAQGGDAASRRRQRGEDTAPPLGARPAYYQWATVVTVRLVVCGLPFRLLPSTPFRHCCPCLPHVFRTLPATLCASPRPSALPTRTYGQRRQREHTQAHKFIHAQAHVQASTRSHAHTRPRGWQHACRVTARAHALPSTLASSAILTYMPYSICRK